MDKLTAWLVTVLGVLLLLPLFGVSQLGTPLSGIMGWLVALLVLALGLMGLFYPKK